MDAAMANIPSGWEVIGQAISQDLALTQNGSSDEQVRVQQLQAQLIAAKGEIERIGGELEPLVVKGGNYTLDKLELAFNKVYKLAVFVRGAYDDREPDEGQRDSLLEQMADAFQNMKNAADTGLKAISDQNLTISDFEITKVVPAKNEIELLEQQIRRELNTSEDRIKTMHEAVATSQRRVQEQIDAVNSLRDRIRDVEEARLVSAVSVSVPTNVAITPYIRRNFNVNTSCCSSLARESVFWSTMVFVLALVTSLTKLTNVSTSPIVSWAKRDTN